MPKLGLPNADVADAMPPKLRGIARLFRDLGERHRQGKAQGRLPARVLVEQTIAQLDGWLTRPVDQDPLLVAPSLAVVDPERWTAGLRAVAPRGTVQPNPESAPQEAPTADRCRLLDRHTRRYSKEWPWPRFAFGGLALAPPS